MLDCMAHLFRPVSATCAFLPLDGARFAARPGHFGPTDERGKSTQKGDDVPLMANRGWPVAAEKKRLDSGASHYFGETESTIALTASGSGISLRGGISVAAWCASSAQFRRRYRQLNEFGVGSGVSAGYADRS
jgi:hypothetical protein